MNVVLSRMIAIFAVALLTASGCGGAARAGRGSPDEGMSDKERVAAIIQARSDTTRYRPTEADVYFMTGMIPHHAQAVLMSGFAETRAQTQGVKILAERIIVAQRDEIGIMRRWLGTRKLPVPDSNATHHRMNMGGTTHDMLMPGMLTDEEMTRLRNARGVAFDRLFLTLMIKHHEGAVSMVDDLFGSPGAGQEETVFKFASDVYADQTAEIDRMQKMLAALPPG